MSRRRVRVYPDRETLAAAAADLTERQARIAVRRRGQFSLVLAGGSTPRAAYERLASEPCLSAIDWERTRFFFSDERCVPPSHSDSNYNMAAKALISRLEQPAGSVHRIKGELAPQRAAREYEAEIRARFVHDQPRFDLTFLGLGADGHTASLFAGGDMGDDGLAVAAIAPSEPRERVSLSLRAINSSRLIAFLVSGSGKAAMVARVLEGGIDQALPATLIAPQRGRLLWLLDRTAASELSAETGG